MNSVEYLVCASVQLLSFLSCWLLFLQQIWGVFTSKMWLLDIITRHEWLYLVLLSYILCVYMNSKDWGKSHHYLFASAVREDGCCDIHLAVSCIAKLISIDFFMLTAYLYHWSLIQLFLQGRAFRHCTWSRLPDVALYWYFFMSLEHVILSSWLLIINECNKKDNYDTVKRRWIWFSFITCVKAR